ncbi:hypothetical protein V6Z12_D10G100200 [Gossypium hirsutum]
MKKINLSSKLIEKSAYYSKVVEDLYYKLQQQQDWVKYQKHRRQMEYYDLFQNHWSPLRARRKARRSFFKLLVSKRK